MYNLHDSVPNVPLFAGHGTSAIHDQEQRQQLAREAASPTTRLLLSSCHQAFIKELSSLSDSDRSETDVDLEDFPTPESLILLPRERHSHNPILSGSLLFLTHTIRYMRFVEEYAATNGSTSPYMDLLRLNTSQGIGILGFSSGILAAFVVGSSSTSVAFVSRALEAYRLALWIGIRTQGYRNRVWREMEPDCDPALPWGVVIVGASQEVAEKQISERKDCCSLSITSRISDSCITVSGHPSHLAAFQHDLPPSTTTSRTTLDTLYHSPRLNDTREQLLQDAALRNIQFPSFADLLVPIRSTYTGDLLTTSTLGRSVEHVVDMLLLHPVNWDLVMRKALSSCSTSPSVCLLNFGPGAGLARSTQRLFTGPAASILDLSGGITSRAQAQEPIAIIGMAVNMPGAPNAARLWELLENGINTVSEIPEHRFAVSDYLHSSDGKTRTMKAHTGNFIDGVDEFDNKFFKISPREAKSMDPQQRILLHTSYEALEDAGYVPNATPCFDPETFGSFVGVATNDYVQNLRNDIDVYYSTGTLPAFLSGRISYAMKMSGPSLVVDTACSSSMVAVYQGCRALMNRDCNAALVGGVNVVSSPDMFIGLDRGHFLSPTGQCKAFDASADGYSRAEGCGMFVLKRLSDAVKEHDTILGVIRGVEVNQSGTSHSITHPHAPTQAALFKKTLLNAGISAERVNVVEAHGTGTQAGDPNELKSIRSVFASRRPPSNPLHITSIKANVGHLEAASGAAGLAKLLLMLQHKQIPRQISLKALNPSISALHEDNTVIDVEHAPWLPSHEGKTRVAMLNNFGAAGSNTSLLLEEHAPVPSSSSLAVDYPLVFGISAKTEVALNELRARYLTWLQDFTNEAVPLPDIVYTSTARRQLYSHRLAFPVKTREELIQKLADAPTVIASEEPTRVVLVFSGQGGQWLGMGQRLYHTSPLFREKIDECHSFLIGAGFPGVLPIVNPGKEGSGLAELEQFQAYQAAIFALEYSLAQLWMSWGVEVVAVVGHSLGEYAALVIAGVLSLRSALLIVAHRVRLMVTKCATGTTGMIAVNLGPEAISAVLASEPTFLGLSIACYNSPTDCVVSGPMGQLKQFKNYLDVELHCRSTILNVPFGYHSEAMMPLLAQLTEICEKRTINAPRIPIVSNVTGTLVLPGDRTVFGPDYFARHCAEPVMFNKGINSLVSKGGFSKIDAWIEVGPHTSTLPMLKANAMISQGSLLLGSLKKQQDPWAILTTSLSQLYLCSSGLDWRAIFAHCPSACTRLPSYPFAKTKFWVQFKEGEQRSMAEEAPSPESPVEHLIPEFTMLRRWAQYPDPSNDFTAVYETPLAELAHSIVGHSVGGMPLCPASVYIEQVLAGVRMAMRHLNASAAPQVMLKTMEFAKPLVYSADVQRTVVTTIMIREGCGSFTVGSRLDSSTTMSTHVSGEYRLQTPSSLDIKFSRLLPSISRQMDAVCEGRADEPPEVLSTRTIYEVVFPRVVDYSKEYRTIRSLTLSSRGMEGRALVKLPLDYDPGKYVVHPVFVDTLLHVAGFVANMQGGANDAYICSEVGAVKVLPESVDNSATYAVFCSNTWLPDEGVMLADAYAVKMGEAQKVVAHLKGMQFRRVKLSSLKKSLLHASGQKAGTSQAMAPVSALKLKAKVHILDTPEQVVVAAAPFADQVFNDIIKVVASTCDVSLSAIDAFTELSSLGVDSLMSIELLAKLQSLFPTMTLDSHLLASCQTIQDIMHHILPHQGDSAVAPHSAPASPLSLVPTLVGSDRPEPLVLDKELDVKELLANVLGVETHEMEDEAELESLGLDSLTSIEALQVLNESFKLDLSSSFFINYPTLNAVKSYISSHLKVLRVSSKAGKNESSTPDQPTHAGVERLGKLLQLDTVPILIQNSSQAGNTLPLFLIHDGSGLVNYYDKLGKLDRTIWGIHNPNFLAAKPWDSLVQMASAYAEYIMSKSSGPILIGGWSFGGIAAYETARQLRLKGLTVKGILLIDSPCPTNHVPLSDSLIDSVMSKTPTNDLTPLVTAQFRMSPYLLAAYRPKVMAEEHPTPAVLLFSSQGYSAPEVNDVPQWLSERGTPRASSQAVEGWQKLVGAPVRVLDIPGNHFEAFHPSNMNEMTARISQACGYLEKPDI